MIASRIVIVGLGLMGGSLARALAATPSPPRLIGVDVSAETRLLATQSGLFDTVGASLVGIDVQSDDLVVFAAPVRAILGLIDDLPQQVPDGCLVMDLGSTKAEICAALDRLPPQFQAVGGHPMCGKEVGGFAHASAELYRQQTFILTPTPQTSERALAAATRMIAALDGRLLLLDPQTHDVLVATVSHGPYVTSALLMHLAATESAHAPELWRVAASGFRDASRLAGSAPMMMGDILLTNRDAVRRFLAAYRAQLDTVLSWLDSADDAALVAWMGSVRDAHAGYQTQKMRDAGALDNE